MTQADADINIWVWTLDCIFFYFLAEVYGIYGMMVKSQGHGPPWPSCVYATVDEGTVTSAMGKRRSFAKSQKPRLYSLNC